MRRLLFISGNFYPEPTGIGKYSGEMVDWLSQNGYSCTVVTTFPYYPDWKVRPEYAKSRFWYKKEIKIGNTPNDQPITIIRCPHYIPTSPTGFKRLLSAFSISFFCYIAVVFLLFSRKFNYVFTIAPPFELGLIGILFKKIQGAVFVYHIQDLQIDAARELGMVRSGFALKTLSSIENYIIKVADHISTISDGMIKKIQLKTDKYIILCPNWVRTDLFYPVWDRDRLKTRFGFKTTDRIVLYSGAIGVKQGLESVIHSAKAFSQNQHIKFVICGTGPYRGHLERLQKAENVTNVVFLPLQSHENLNSFLNMADVHLIIQKSNASDLVMPSKLSTILAVGGIPIVTASSGTSLYNLLNASNIGFVIEPDDQQALTFAIKNALEFENYEKSRNARSFAEDHLSTDYVLSKYLSTILSASKNPVNQKGQRPASRIAKFN